MAANSAPVPATTPDANVGRGFLRVRDGLMVDSDNVEELAKIEAVIERRRRQYAVVLAAGAVANSLPLGSRWTPTSRQSPCSTRGHDRGSGLT